MLPSHVLFGAYTIDCSANKGSLSCGQLTTIWMRFVRLLAKQHISQFKLSELTQFPDPVSQGSVEAVLMR